MTMPAYRRPRLRHSATSVVALAGLLGLLATATVFAQAQDAQPATRPLAKVRVLGPNTPLRSGPGPANAALVLVAADTVLDVVAQVGGWYEVTLRADLAPKAKAPKTAFVFARLVEVVDSDGSRSRLASLNENAQSMPTWPDEPARAPDDQVLQLDSAKLMYQQGKKTKEVDCAVIYDNTTMTVAPYDLKKNEPDPTVALKYVDIASAEYSYGKSPRRESASSDGPGVFVSDRGTHWLVVTTKNGDSAVMTLDKGNYKRVIAELENRAGIKVQLNGPAK